MVTYGCCKEGYGGFRRSHCYLHPYPERFSARFVHANVLFQGVIHEVKKDYQNAEIAYRNCCNLISTHALGLERWVDSTCDSARHWRPQYNASSARGSSPQNAAIWYLLGRCYMASRQYRDAYLAYNEGVNLEPNEPRIWVSLECSTTLTGSTRRASACSREPCG